MKTILFKLIICLIIFFIISLLLSFTNIKNLNIDFINIQDILFTVIGIVFSVGYSVIIGFSLSGIKNEEYLNSFRKDLNNISIAFIIYFMLSILVYILSKIDFGLTFINIFCVLTLIYIIIFLIYNFHRLQETKMQIEDRLQKENNKNK
ncbi:hypothetical protein EPJ79_07970 [Brachyspira aalborgi]|uniref:DUF3021 domain-containing protein n=1 Tax=Brachyspira aalborgi TaxID=29522 RepID=A0A5C8D769_9SPIR|nr:hypothetical protein [Brachyspira aalborgi]TXJ21056.1 hypothetical protein EPJ79_07970 [Brachyspira aalborgi]